MCKIWVFQNTHHTLETLDFEQNAESDQVKKQRFAKGKRLGVFHLQHAAVAFVKEI